MPPPPSRSPEDATTHPPAEDDGLVFGAKPGDVAVLVIAWSRDHASRVGEIAVFDPGSKAWSLGRGAGKDDSRTRIAFVRQRPDSITATPVLLGEDLSREHLHFDQTPIGIEVTNHGEQPLLVNGAVVTAKRTILVAGDVLEIKGVVLFLYLHRPATIPQSDYPTSFAFGAPDAHGIIGESPAAWALRERIAFAAKSSRHVLLHGASGTGKELAARAIHAMSARARGPFIARNAATFTAGLIDSELFGNVRNYPNPGMPERPGIVGKVDGGTFFLDEIAELPESMQSHLLRVLDANGEYHRLGEAEARRSDFRLIGATNRELSSLKHDLLARMSVRIELPSIEARREDIPLLVRHLLLETARNEPAIAARFVRRGDDGRDDVSVHPALITALLRRPLATNVRELDALLWSAVSATLGPTLLPTTELLAPMPRRPSLAPRAKPAVEQGASDVRAIDDLIAGIGRMPSLAEARLALAEHRWNKTATAKSLGISRDALKRLLAKDE